MFSIAFSEILIVVLVGLLVFGPEKLPQAVRTFAFGFAKLKRSWHATRRELEQEIGMDEIRREIHNAQVLEDLERAKSAVREPFDNANQMLNEPSINPSIGANLKPTDEDPENAHKTDITDASEDSNNLASVGSLENTNRPDSKDD